MSAFVCNPELQRAALRTQTMTSGTTKSARTRNTVRYRHLLRPTENQRFSIALCRIVCGTRISPLGSHMSTVIRRINVQTTMRMHIDAKCSVGLPVTQHTIKIYTLKKKTTDEINTQLITKQMLCVDTVRVGVVPTEPRTQQTNVVDNWIGPIANR